MALASVPLDQCPTCQSKIHYHDADTYYRINGTYRYKGEEHECDCDTQILLRKHYLAANIGDQYQRLNWDDFRDQKVREEVNTYLDNWRTIRLQGMGLEFASPGLATGKTFAATYVAKELIKRGERVWFHPFIELIGLYQQPEQERVEIEARLRNSSVLILDEVLPPNTFAQGQLFAAKLEELIRFRTNFNRVIIMTTNLEPDELHEYYPRVYSLIEAKQLRIFLSGDDARRTVIRDNNLRMLMEGEVAPIT
jgi:DNA replication protein DnaC